MQLQPEVCYECGKSTSLVERTPSAYNEQEATNGIGGLERESCRLIYLVSKSVSGTKCPS